MAQPPGKPTELRPEITDNTLIQLHGWNNAQNDAPLFVGPLADLTAVSQSWSWPDGPMRGTAWHDGIPGGQPIDLVIGNMAPVAVSDARDLRGSANPTNWPQHAGIASYQKAWTHHPAYQSAAFVPPDVTGDVIRQRFGRPVLDPQALAATWTDPAFSSLRGHLDSQIGYVDPMAPMQQTEASAPSVVSSPESQEQPEPDGLADTGFDNGIHQVRSYDWIELQNPQQPWKEPIGAGTTEDLHERVLAGKYQGSTWPMSYPYPVDLNVVIDNGRTFAADRRDVEFARENGFPLIGMDGQELSAEPKDSIVDAQIIDDQPFYRQSDYEAQAGGPGILDAEIIDDEQILPDDEYDARMKEWGMDPQQQNSDNPYLEPGFGDDEDEQVKEIREQPLPDITELPTHVQPETPLPDLSSSALPFPNAPGKNPFMPDKPLGPAPGRASSQAGLSAIRYRVGGPGPSALGAHLPPQAKPRPSAADVVRQLDEQQTIDPTPGFDEPQA